MPFHFNCNANKLLNQDLISMDSVKNIQEMLNLAEDLFAKLTIHDKYPRTTQDEMPNTQELKRLRSPHNSQPKQITIMLQKNYKVHINLYWSFFIFKTFTTDFSYSIYSALKVKSSLESSNFAGS